MLDQLTPRFSSGFAADLAEVDTRSLAIGQHVRKVIRQLQSFPESGSPQPRESLTERYGEGIRIRPIDGYILVYRFDEEALVLIALVWGALVK